MHPIPKQLRAILVLVLTAFSCLADPASIDTNFSCVITGIEVKAVVSLPDDSLLVGGNFTNVNGFAKSNLVHLAADGTMGDSIAEPNGAVEFITTEPDGKILIGGSFLEINGVPRTRLARLHQDGSLDSSFVAPTNLSATVFVIARQSDGKLLVGLGNGQVFRLHPDGALDATFIFTMPNSTGIFGLALRSGGRVLVGGRTLSSFSSTMPLYSLNADGSIDASFSRPPIYSTSSPWVRRVVLDEAGRILIAGSFDAVNGISRSCIARLHADGSMDTTFSPGSGSNATLRDMRLQKDGRIVVVGGFFQFDGQALRSIARLNVDGSMDLGFNPGNTFSSSAYCLSIRPDDRIVFGSSTTVSNRAVVRLQGGNVPEAAPSIVRQPVGKTVNEGTNVSFSVLASGSPLNFQWRINGTNILGATNSHIFISRSLAHHSGTYTVVVSNSLGTVTSSPANLTVNTYAQGSFYSTNYARVFFQSASGFIYSAALAPDGNVVIGGYFTSINTFSGGYGSIRNGIAKVYPDGANDLSFWPTSGVASSSHGYATVMAVGVQPDGKILIGGDFYYAENSVRNGLARYNTNGTIDSSFNPGYISDEPDIFVVQPDGKILLGGFAYAGGNHGVVRLTSIGAADPAFKTGLPVRSWVPAVALDGEKILIGGCFTNIQSTIGRTNIARLNADGSIDETFTQGAAPNDWVITLATQPDHKIVIGGRFTTVNGLNRNRIARLNADGTVDSTFNPGSGANGQIISVALQADGKIIISGSFSSFSGVSVPGIARLRSNGTVDTTFSGAAGGGQVLVETNGNILVVGTSGIFRLRGDLNALQSPALLSGSTMTSGGLSFNFQGEFGRPYTLEHSTNLANWTPLTNFVSSDTGVTIQIPTNRPSDFFRARGN